MTSTIHSFQGPHRFLSNFWAASVEFEGQIYPSVEHAYQAAKTLNPNYRDQIRQAPTPSKAKQIGAHVPLRMDWEQRKLSIMRDLLQKKFKNKKLAHLLSATGSANLVEGNTWGDYFWGVCDGFGENHLGILLMEIRAKIQEPEKMKGDRS